MKAKWDGKKKAVVLTTVMTAVVLTLRIVLMPRRRTPDGSV